MRTAHSLPYGGSLSKGVSLIDPMDRDPPGRDPLDRDPLYREPPCRDPRAETPLGLRSPWTETPLDRDPPGQRPLDRDPPGQRLPGQRFPLLDRDPLDGDQDPPPLFTDRHL